MIVNGHIRDMSGHTGDATGQGRDSEWTYWRWGMDISRTSYKKNETLQVIISKWICPCFKLLN